VLAREMLVGITDRKNKK